MQSAGKECPKVFRWSTSRRIIKRLSIRAVRRVPAPLRAEVLSRARILADVSKVGARWAQQMQPLLGTEQTPEREAAPRAHEPATEPVSPVSALELELPVADTEGTQMGSSNKRELQAELQMALPELITYLEALVNGLRDGRVYLQHGDQVVDLCPSHSVTLEIEAKQKKDKDKVSIEMSWRRSAIRDGQTPELEISSEGGARRE